MRLLSIVGARPQFVKMAVVCRALNTKTFRTSIHHSIVHTGQHYDRDMSTVFFSELSIPNPDFHLGVGSGTHAVQTAEMMKRLEPVLTEHQPDWVLLYGDTNSTLAGAIVCAKLGIRTAHIEAGLRSFNRRMPEEINRIATDHLSDILFCPTDESMCNLANEGLSDRAVLSGDIMYDASLYYRDLAASRGGDLAEKFPPKTFALATIHRAENTDDPERLRSILRALEYIALNTIPVVLPLHPRTRSRIEVAGIELRAITIVPPVSYLEMLLLESRARFIITDSGGVQKEAYFVNVPCITTREETEWIETLENGCNVLTGPDDGAIIAAATKTAQAGPWSNPYGNGDSCEVILHSLQSRHLLEAPAQVAELA